MTLSSKKVAPLTLIYLISKGQVLLLKRNNNKSMFPGQILGIGGKLEPGEDLFASAKREFNEETGAEIAEPKLRGTYAWYDDNDEYAGTLYIFTAQSYSGEIKTKSEEGELFWFNLNKLDELTDEPEHQKLFLGKILQDENYFFSGIARYKDGKICEFADNSKYFQERLNK